MQGKKFISPGAWFSMNYPSDWNEFEDGEGSFLFYNPEVWTGNFRISAFKGKAGYGKDVIRQELKENDSASLVKVGTWECAYSKEMFQEEGTYYTSHLWITGVDDIAFECSFTVPKGGVVKEATLLLNWVMPNAPPASSSFPRWESSSFTVRMSIFIPAWYIASMAA